MKIANHDEYARQYLADLRVAREFLEQHLPPEIKAKCNFDKIRVMPNSYVESDLKSHASDIVYQVEFKNGKSCVYTYHLIEQVKQKLPEYGDKMMTYAEELRLEGEQKGKQEGKQETQLQIAKELLEKGVDKELVFSATHLTREQINQINNSH